LRRPRRQVRLQQWTIGEDFSATSSALGREPSRSRTSTCSPDRLHKREIEAANIHVAAPMTVEGAPHLKASTRVFDCAQSVRPHRQPTCPVESHIRMMAAGPPPSFSGRHLQDHNMPNEATSRTARRPISSWAARAQGQRAYRDGEAVEPAELAAHRRRRR